MSARAIDGRVGIWTDFEGREVKIGAIGVRVRRWVTMHGFSINIDPDLDHFSGIIPCGLSDFPVASLSSLGNKASVRALDTALFTQSGAMAITNIERNQFSRIFRAIVSFGNKVDVNVPDLMAHFEQDPKIDVMSMYLEGIAPGDEVILITWLDKGDRDILLVHPRGDLSRPAQGVFSTRSPDRPNPIGLHRVEVVSIEGSTLGVAALEAIDGTPILDIKPVLSAEIGER